MSEFRRLILVAALTVLLTIRHRRELLVAALMLPALVAATLLAVVWASTERLSLGDHDPVPIIALVDPSSEAEDSTIQDNFDVPAEASVPEKTQHRTEEAKGTEAEALAFDHRATRANIRVNSTYLDAPSINGDPGAFLSITQNWNLGGGPGTHNRKPVGIWYDDYYYLRWAIFNQDLTAMPEGAAFNVAVLRNPTGARQGVLGKPVA